MPPPAMPPPAMSPPAAPQSAAPQPAAIEPSVGRSPSDDGLPGDSPLPADLAARLTRDPQGLICAVVQQHDTGQVLMVAWMDDEALHRTLTGGRVTFWSRSRSEHWRKGDTSGHEQHVRSVSLDCDGDALLVRVDQIGPACHTGTQSCFDGRELPAMGISG